MSILSPHFFRADRDDKSRSGRRLCPLIDEGAMTAKKKRDKDRKSAKLKSKAAAAESSGKTKLDRKTFDKELKKLQIELVKLQEWVKREGLRVVVVFEGRDAAGKGGIIKRILDRVSPRVFRVVALPAPSDRERTQFYYQRYLSHFPAAGEVVLFDRSWYNRAGVERVMGFCAEEEYREFLRTCPNFEQALVRSGIILIKYWLTVSNEEQEKRFLERIEDPRKHWKLSPMDFEARRRWFDYARARDAMLKATDTEWAPWYIVPSNDQRRGRLNCIAHLLSLIPYEDLPYEPATLPPRSTKNEYDDEAALQGRSVVPEVY
jgi:polyphosphate kinase 2